MEIDNNKFINLVLLKTNTKLNDLQARVIILESQLEIAMETADQLKKELDKVKKPNGKSDY